MGTTKICTNNKISRLGSGIIITSNTSSLIESADLDYILGKKKELEEAIAQLGEEALRKEFKKIFEENPDLVSFSFSGYTPYFNDGDECVYGISGLDYKLTDDGDDVDEHDFDGDYEFYGHKHHAYYSKYNLTEEYTQKQEAIFANKGPVHLAMYHLARKLQGNSEVVKTIFGDHQNFFVTPEAIKMEFYEHE